MRARERVCTYGIPVAVGSKDGLSVDPSVASNAFISSARDWAQFVSGRPGVGLSPYTNQNPEHHAMGQPLSCRPFCGSRKKKVAFAGGRLNALTLCWRSWRSICGGRRVVGAGIKYL